MEKRRRDGAERSRGGEDRGGEEWRSRGKDDMRGGEEGRMRGSEGEIMRGG